MNFLVRMVTALSAMAEAALKRMEALELEEGDGEEESPDLGLIRAAKP